MQHPYDVLAPEYATLLAGMHVDAGREHELAARAAAVRELGELHREEWAEVTVKTVFLRLDATLALVDAPQAPALPSPASGGDGGLHVPPPASVPVGGWRRTSRRQRYHMASGIA